MDKHTKKLLGSYQKTFFILLFLIPGMRKIIGKKMKCLIGKVAVVIIICIFCNRVIMKFFV